MTAALALVAGPPNPPSSMPPRFLSLEGDVIRLPSDVDVLPSADEHVVFPTLDIDADDASAERVAVEPSALLTSTNGALSFRATVSPVVVPIGAPVSIRLEATDRTGDPVKFVHEIGSGSSSMRRGESFCGSRPDRRPGPDSAEPRPQRRNLILAFSEPGDHVVTLEAWSGPCREERSATVALVVRALAGRLRANGPILPDVRAVQYDTGDPRRLGIGIRTRDKDGYISELRVDWGDGTPPDIQSWSLRECDRRDLPWPFGERDATARHRYAPGGRHDVTVTAVSVGCNGKERQEGSTRLTVRVPSVKAS